MPTAFASCIHKWGVFQMLLLLVCGADVLAWTCVPAPAALPVPVRPRTTLLGAATFVPEADSGAGINTEMVDLKGISVAPICIGTWAWGDRLFWGYDESQDENLQAVFNYSMDAGINFFDTAEVYGFGRSELLCNRFMRQYTGSSKGAVIATKFAALPFRIGSKAVVRACRESLDRLGLDSIDLYQLHWPGVWQNEEYWDGLADCYNLGLVKAVGVSNYMPRTLRQVHAKLAARGVPLATNQVQYSLLHRRIEHNGVLRTCEELGVKVMAYSPLAQGILTGKYGGSNLPTGPRGSVVKSILPKAAPLLKSLNSLSQKLDKTNAQVALNWCMQKGTIPIAGARSLVQAKDNAGAMGWRLTQDEMYELDLASMEAGVETPGMPLAA